MSNILEKDYPELNITEQTIENIKKHPRLYRNSPTRISMGKIYTTEEFQKRSDEILTMRLPENEKLVLKRERSKWKR